MQNISSREAIKFGLHCLIDRAYFFIQAFFLAILIQLSVLFVGFLIILPFVILLSKLVRKMIFFHPVSSATWLPVEITTLSDISEVFYKMWAKPLLMIDVIVIMFILIFTIFSVIAVIKIGWSRLGLSYYDKKPLRLSVFKFKLPFLFKYVFAHMLFWLIIMLLLIVAALPIVIFTFEMTGVLLWLSIPVGLIAFMYTIFLILKLWFFPYFIIDQNAGIIESFKKSYLFVGLPKKIIFLNIILFLTAIFFQPIIILAVTPLSEVFLYRKFLGR